MRPPTRDHPAMSYQADLARWFAQLHPGAQPLLMPNPWDAGLGAAAARRWASRRWRRRAAASPRRSDACDGSVTRDEALAHAAALAAATDLPVSADLENGFADDPAGVAETVAWRSRPASSAARSRTTPATRPADLRSSWRSARIAAAAEAAHAGPVRLVLTARGENHIRGNPDLDDTIARLQAYGEAGADVLYAPGLTRIEDIRRVVPRSAGPVNVLALPASRRCASSPRPASRGSRSAAACVRGRSPRSGRRRASCGRTGPTAFARTPGGSALARRAFRPRTRHARSAGS